MTKITLSLCSSLLLGTTLLGATLSSTPKNSSLIVYNSNIGLVHEERELNLSKDDTTIVYEDVASSINTDSVNVALPKSISLSSQQYRYDRLTLSKLLEAHLGKKIEARILRNKNEFKIITAELLSYNSKEAIVKTIDYKIMTIPTSSIMFSSIPSELITKPSLVWNVKTDADAKETMKLDYLVSNINFKSDYVLNVDGNSSSLVGWISINNHSGKQFEDTKLSLLAGDINTQQPKHFKRQMRAMSVMQDAPKVQEQAFEGYHFYTIPFKVTLANNEKTQIKFLAKQNLAISREYSARLNNPLYLIGERDSSVKQSFLLDGMKEPLPSGTLRVYSKLDDKTILLGENSIAHTPANTPLKIEVGKNFDLKVTQSVVKRQDNDQMFNVDLLYSLKNSSDENKTIKLEIPFNRHQDSKINTTQAYEFTKGNLATFTLEVPAKQTKKFTVNYESKK